jgi:hypothetical protein
MPPCPPLLLDVPGLVKDLKYAIVDQMNFCIATNFSKEYTVYTHSAPSKTLHMATLTISLHILLLRQLFRPQTIMFSRRQTHSRIDDADPE